MQKSIVDVQSFKDQLKWLEKKVSEVGGFKPTNDEVMFENVAAKYLLTAVAEIKQLLANIGEL